ncbi:MAG: hypothetical protein ACREA0_35020 [bacterium]
MSLADFTQLLRDVSIMFAAWAGMYGLDAWRREFRGRREIELAEESLALFYEARDAIAAIRSPGGWVGEGMSRKAGEDESAAEKSARDQAFVLMERYARFQELFGKIHARRYRFMAAFGEKAAKPFDDLHGILNDLFLASRMLATLWTRTRTGSTPRDETHWAKVEKHESIFWDSGDDDPINPRLQAAVSNLELTCRAIIQGRGTLHGVLNIPIFRRRAPANQTR